eukprot:scaffold9841_cov102-Cylindrotheca_fusiformis.AAC.1
MTFGQLAKYTSHMYKNLTPEEKATWVARSEQDKARYDAELASYVPPPGHDARGVLIEDHRPRRKNKRGPKDPAAPKRPSGAYVFFTNDMRPKVLSEYPGIKFVELGKVLGERWRALSPDEKKQYEQLAAEDKVRFQMEMQQYTANQAAQAPPVVPPPPPHMMAPLSSSDHAAAAAAAAHHQQQQQQQYYTDPNAAYAAQYAHDPYAQHAQYHAA